MMTTMEMVLTLGAAGAGAVAMLIRSDKAPPYALPLAVSSLTVAGVVLFLDYRFAHRVIPQYRAHAPARREKARPLSTAGDVGEQFKAAAVKAAAAFDYHADGFHYAVPAGSLYAKVKDPMLLALIAPDHHTATVQRHVLGINEQKAPEESVQATLEGLKKVNPSYEFSQLAGNDKEFLVWFTVHRDKGTQRGLFIYRPRGAQLWELIVTAPPAATDDDLLRQASSWTID